MMWTMLEVAVYLTLNCLSYSIKVNGLDSKTYSNSLTSALIPLVGP